MGSFIPPWQTIHVFNLKSGENPIFKFPKKAIAFILVAPKNPKTFDVKNFVLELYPIAVDGNHPWMIYWDRNMIHPDMLFTEAIRTSIYEGVEDYVLQIRDRDSNEVKYKRTIRIPSVPYELRDTAVATKIEIGGSEHFGGWSLSFEEPAKKSSTIIELDKNGKVIKIDER